MELAQWIWALIALGSGLLFGEIAGRMTRGFLARSERWPSLAEAGSRLGNFVFWASTALGVMVAVFFLDADTLRDFEKQLVDDLPKFLLAFLWVITGYAVSVAVAATVGQSARKATGVRQPAIERMLQVVIMVAAVTAALAQIGVSPQMLILLIAVLGGTPCLAMAILSGFGGREVASELAAGRALRHHLRPGRVIRVGALEGTIVAIHSTTVEVESIDGSRNHIPNRRLLSEGFSTN